MTEASDVCIERNQNLPSSQAVTWALKVHQKLLPWKIWHVKHIQDTKDAHITWFHHVILWIFKFIDLYMI